MLDRFLDYVGGKTYEEIQEDYNLNDGEIFLPESENILEFVMLPAGKYEMLIRDSEKLAAVIRYICSDNPQFKGVKALLEVE